MSCMYDLLHSNEISRIYVPLYLLKLNYSMTMCFTRFVLEQEAIHYWFTMQLQVNKFQSWTVVLVKVHFEV